MSDIMLEINEDASSKGGMTGCLSCSVDIFTVESTKRFAAGLQVGYLASYSLYIRLPRPVPEV